MEEVNRKDDEVVDSADLFVSLPEEELQKIIPISEEEIIAALEQGRVERCAVEANAYPMQPGSSTRFR